MSVFCSIAHNWEHSTEDHPVKGLKHYDNLPFYVRTCKRCGKRQFLRFSISYMTTLWGMITHKPWKDFPVKKGEVVHFKQIPL